MPVRPFGSSLPRPCESTFGPSVAPAGRRDGPTPRVGRGVVRRNEGRPEPATDYWKVPALTSLNRVVIQATICGSRSSSLV